MAEEKPEQVEKPEVVKVEKPVEQVLELKYPQGFNEQLIKPLLDIYMARHKGFDGSQRAQASIQLAYSLAKVGYNPQQTVAPTLTYLQSLGEIVNTIPDTPETVGVKANIMTRGAVEASRKLESGEGDADARFERLFNKALLMKLIGGLDGEGGNRELLSKMEKIEGKLELQEILTKFAGKPEDLAEALEKHARVHTSVQAIAGEENTADFKMQALRTLSKGMSMVKKGIETKEKPPRQEVQQLPPTHRVEIPIPVKPQPLAQNPARTPVEVQAQPAPQPALAQPAEAPPAPAPPSGLPETVRLDPGELPPDKFGLWKPKK